jgi:4-hydroxybenzoyl-CoA reductase subunit beta
MMRLPLFRYESPSSISEAARILAGEGPRAQLLAGGTDLLPNMKRRQQTPAVVIGLRKIAALSESRWGVEGSVNGNRSVSLGACTTLTQLVRNRRLAEAAPALWEAAAQIATPHLRSMGTLGGNLCLDTRCNYYDQNYEWRKAIDFCMKKDGKICWVATSSPRCLAVSSTDTAPALLALGARIRLVSIKGEREIALSDLYRNDGIEYLTRRPDEILTEVMLDLPVGWRSTYWKLRRRGAIDFPVLSVAAAARFEGAGRGARVAEARIVLGSVASRPLLADEASAGLVGRALGDEAIEEAATRAARLAKPMDNTDFVLGWRKRVTREFVTYALRQLRGDDPRDVRERFTHHGLIAQGSIS